MWLEIRRNTVRLDLLVYGLVLELVDSVETVFSVLDSRAYVMYEMVLLKALSNPTRVRRYLAFPFDNLSTASLQPSSLKSMVSTQLMIRCQRTALYVTISSSCITDLLMFCLLAN